MSPYEDSYVDVKFVDKIAGYVTVTVDKEFQRWHLFCLAFGFVLLLLAPVVSSWVPFYYSSSMAVGVFLVIIILLFSATSVGAWVYYHFGMKLLPTGIKNVFYLKKKKYGSVLGAGSFLSRHCSMLVNSILFSFGLSEEMHNPVSIFALLGIVVAGAALGYWMPHLSSRVLLILLWQWGHWLLVYQSAFLSLFSSGVVQIKLLAPFFPYSPLASGWQTG
ncbi:hypothetical protein LOK49_LG12G02303 [Camellia lanceoleosa]|uniref:Uncharacterized protein n=1 Tax=Camellia lanceoleosa TaxID=1840588 RepID=A0ACC0FVJ1_9ERIC|nr:hypothetical protein LOK49_LG12G02303 [Camellia lanceoleosa]